MFVFPIFQTLPGVVPNIRAGFPSVDATGAGRLNNQITQQPVKQPKEKKTTTNKPGPEPRERPEPCGPELPEGPDRIHVRYG